MVESTELVSHRMAHSEERVRKSHTRHGGGVRHLLTRLRIIGTVVIAAGKIFKYIFKSAYCEAVRVIGGKHRRIRLKSMGHGVDTGGGSQTLGLVHHHIRIDNRHVRKQLIVGKRVFHSADLIGDNCEGSDLGACSR